MKKINKISRKNIKRIIQKVEKKTKFKPKF